MNFVLAYPQIGLPHNELCTESWSELFQNYILAAITGIQNKNVIEINVLLF